MFVSSAASPTIRRSVCEASVRPRVRRSNPRPPRNRPGLFVPCDRRPGRREPPCRQPVGKRVPIRAWLHDDLRRHGQRARSQCRGVAGGAQPQAASGLRRHAGRSTRSLESAGPVPSGSPTSRLRGRIIRAAGGRASDRLPRPARRAARREKSAPDRAAGVAVCSARTRRRAKLEQLSRL
jgi:hypothetical protein